MKWRFIHSIFFKMYRSLLFFKSFSVSLIFTYSCCSASFDSFTHPCNWQRMHVICKRTFFICIFQFQPNGFVLYLRTTLFLHEISSCGNRLFLLLFSFQTQCFHFLLRKTEKNICIVISIICAYLVVFKGVNAFRHYFVRRLKYKRTSHAL